MALKIGLFSLKPDAGCTALAVHMANFLAGSDKYTVALVEKLSFQRESEYKNINMKRDEDGTYMLNNVRYYPGDVDIEVTETIVICDLGQINAAYKFDSDYDKLFLCTDNDMDRLNDILQFRNDADIEFDCVLFGAGRNQIGVYSSEGLRAIVIGDKKEERLDSNLAGRISLFMRTKGYIPPEYHKDWTYAPALFTGYVDPENNDAKNRRKNKDKSKPVKDEESVIIDVPESSDLNTLNTVDKLESNVFGDFCFVDLPKPEDIPEPITDEETDLEEEKQRLIEEEKERLIKAEEARIAEAKRLAAIKEKADKDAKERLERLEEDDSDRSTIDLDAKEAALAEMERRLKAREEILREREANIQKKTDYVDEKYECPKRINEDEQTHFSPAPISPGDRSVLARALELINRDHKQCCNIFLVTDSDKLFIFSSPVVFVSKLKAIRREIRNVQNIHYIVVTYNNEEREPAILTDDKKLEDVYFLLKSLDFELRAKSHLSDDELRKHRELILFNEILYSS